MRQRQGNTWVIVALPTVATPAGTPIATPIVTRTVIRTATRTVTTLVVEVMQDMIVTETVTLTEETAVTGERGVARPRQGAVGVGIALLQAPGVDSRVTVGPHLERVAAARRNPDLVRLTTVLMPLLHLPHRRPMEGGESLKRQKFYGRARCFLATDVMCGRLEGDRKKKKRRPGLYLSLYSFTRSLKFP